MITSGRKGSPAVLAGPTIPWMLDGRDGGVCVAVDWHTRFHHLCTQPSVRVVPPAASGCEAGACGGADVFDVHRLEAELSVTAVLLPIGTVFLTRPASSGFISLHAPSPLLPRQALAYRFAHQLDESTLRTTASMARNAVCTSQLAVHFAITSWPNVRATSLV